MKYLWPLADSITTRNFYFESSLYVGGQHAATDRIKRIGSTLGANLVAAADGMVIGDAWDPYSGYFIGIRHADGWICFVRHLVADSPLVRGQLVKQGQVIGRAGSTGASSGPHAHIDWWNEQRRSPEAVYKHGWWAHDPESYLGKEVPEEEEEMKLWLIKPTTPDAKGSVYVTDGIHKRRANRMLNDLQATIGLQNTVAIVVSDLFLTWLADFPEGPAP